MPSPSTPIATNIHPINATSVIHRGDGTRIWNRVLRASWISSGPSSATPTATAPDDHKSHEKYISRTVIRCASVSDDAFITSDSRPIILLPYLVQRDRRRLYRLPSHDFPVGSCPWLSDAIVRPGAGLRELSPD